jgi:hypothetical protein
MFTPCAHTFLSPFFSSQILCVGKMVHQIEIQSLLVQKQNTQDIIDQQLPLLQQVESEMREWLGNRDKVKQEWSAELETLVQQHNLLKSTLLSAEVCFHVFM